MLIRRRLLKTCILIGMLSLTLTASLFAQTRPHYAEQDSARFRILYSPKDAGVVRELWNVLRVRVPQVEGELQLALGDTVTFIIAPDEREWSRLTQGSPLWANGLAYPERGVAILKSPSFGIKYGPFPTTAVHEYVHLLLRAGAERAAIPRWLDEGLAQVLSGQFDYVETTTLARAAAANRLHSFSQLEMMLAMSGMEARQGYAESAVAVQLLQLKYGMSGLSNLVHELRTGRDYDDAFSTVFGMAPGGFENQYIAYVRNTYKLTLLGDTELWVSVVFIVLILAAGTAAWMRRRKTIAKWNREEGGQVVHAEETWPPYVVNYTIIRNRQDAEANGTQDSEPAPDDQPPLG